MERHVVIGGSNPNDPDSIGLTCRIHDDDEHRIMIDCGTEFSVDPQTKQRYIRTPNLTHLQDGRLIDAVVLTHSHLDHIGYLLAMRKYLKEDFIIWATPQTFEMLSIAVDDTLKFSPELATFLDTLDITDPERFLIVQPGENVILPGKKIFARPNGHTTGSFSPIIRFNNGKNGWMTSDWCPQNQPIVDGASLISESVPAEWIPDFVLGTDLTYALERRPMSDPNEYREFELARLKTAILEVQNRGGHVIIPAFAKDRGPCLAADISAMGFTVHIDGGVRSGIDRCATIKWSDKDRNDFSTENIVYVPSGKGAAEFRKELMASTTPAVIVTTAGFCEGGPVMNYFPNVLPSSKHAVFFVGYPGPVGMRGREIFDSRGVKGAAVELPIGREIDEFGKPKNVKRVAVNCSIDRFGLGAHCYLEDNVRHIGDIVSARDGKKLEGLVLSHGTRDAKRTAYLELADFAEDGKTIFANENTVIEIG